MYNTSWVVEQTVYGAFTLTTRILIMSAVGCNDNYLGHCAPEHVITAQGLDEPFDIVEHL